MTDNVPVIITNRSDHDRYPASVQQMLHDAIVNLSFNLPIFNMTGYKQV